MNWIGLGGVIVIADYVLWKRNRETLSATWGRWLRTPQGRFWCSATWTGVSLHLWMGQIRNLRALQEATSRLLLLQERRRERTNCSA